MKPNPLMIVAAVFAASFAGRAIGMANAALSKDEKAAISHDETTNEDHAAKIAAANTVAPSPPASQPSPPRVDDKALTNSIEKKMNNAGAPSSSAHKAMQHGELLAAIRERAEHLDERALEVEDRIRVLEILEKRIEERLAELRESNEELSKLVSFANEASQKDISLLAKMYEQMKPKKAGEIFDKMNPAFAAGFLTEMNSESAALILTNMSTDHAYETSMIIASRNAAVHKQ